MIGVWRYVGGIGVDNLINSRLDVEGRAWLKSQSRISELGSRESRSNMGRLILTLILIVKLRLLLLLLLLWGWTS